MHRIVEIVVVMFCCICLEINWRVSDDTVMHLATGDGMCAASLYIVLLLYCYLKTRPSDCFFSLFYSLFLALAQQVARLVIGHPCYSQTGRSHYGVGHRVYTSLINIVACMMHVQCIKFS